MFLAFMTSMVPITVTAESISCTITYNKTPQFGTDTLGGVTYTTVRYDELFSINSPGMPSLPVDYIHFSVPYNATDFSVTLTVGSSIQYAIPHKLYPCQEPRYTIDSLESNITLPDSIVYNSGQYYPSRRAWVVNDGFIAGENHIVKVAVMPFTYLHTATQDKLRKNRNVTITLNYIISDTVSVYPLVRKKESRRNEGYKYAKSLVVNANSVIDNAMTSISLDNMGIQYTGNIPILSLNYIDSIYYSHENNNFSYLYPNYDYIIITVDSLKRSLKRLSAYKRQKGYNVGIVTVEEIISEDTSLPWYQNIKANQMNDSARIIREYLKYAYCIGDAKFVILAGKDVPFKYGWFNSVPTDQYYIDLSSEWEKPYLETYPELFVGRIIAKKTHQIKNFTDKLLRYELNPGNGDYTYLKKALYTNGYDQEE